MKKSRKALLSSALSLLLCFTMLLGTTFAWFTDSVTSTNNIIKSGKLDVEMSWSDTKDGTFKDASTGAIFDYEYWEPGFTQIKYVKIDNVGNLAFRYVLNIIPNTMPAAGEVNLADVIDVYLVDTSKGDITRETLAGLTPVGTLSALMADSNGAARGVMLPVEGATNVTLNESDKTIAQTGTATYCIALKMQESAGNEYQDKTVGGGFAVQLLATQYTYENDTFGNDYDTNSAYPGMINFSASAAVTADTDGALAEDTTIGAADKINADVPAGVKLAEGTTELKLSVETMIGSEANVELNNGETKQSLDIHIEGVAEDNTVPMLITLPGLLKTGLNSTSVAMYHVENGVTVPMTMVANPTNHNEFSYDPATGNVVLCVKSFSEYTAVTDNWNLWEGKAASAFNSGIGTAENPYVIATAEQLAYFGLCVDNGNTFKGQYVVLNNDIDLGGTISFNPIGCGYAPETGVTNSNNVPGYAFMGTFDGQNHTISNLYQSGWDLGLEYCNLGGGLFASIADGTVQNLTISGANIVMECVEMGVLVGLSQGDCIYENINIYNSKIANYQRATGGLIGEVSGDGTTTINTVTIGSDVVVGSLWGDFDCPVGGVIGARWDNAGKDPQIVMKNVTVACRLDVYNDVTSSYQWYAYRRAGMLIGNTDTPPADGKNSKVATADFLKCSDVTVEYGSWVDYHYCEFNNHNSSWPWVRVEAGENCSAYSNPRYGVPNDPVTKQPVTSIDHNHSGDDEHYVELKFDQLYGGGQGVYGQPDHEGVTVIKYKYKITYINNGKELAVKYVDDNSVAVSTANDTAAAAAEASIGGGYAFSHWINAGSTKVESIEAGNTENVVLYPSYENLYTAMFVDQEGNVLAWDTFTKSNYSNIKTLGGKTVPPKITDCTFDYWEVHVTDENGKTTKTKKLDEYTFADGTDITIYPIYTFEGDVNLVPVDNNGDGITDEYHVGGYSNPNGQSLVEIPDIVNGIKITAINADAFSGYDGVHAVVIPTTVNTVGGNVLAVDWSSYFDGGESVTIYYEGSYDSWVTKEATFTVGWDDGLGTDSRIFFLNGTNKVDPSQGYLQFTRKWTSTGIVSGYYVGDWSHSANITADLQTKYTGKCDCKTCKASNLDRPDKAYWEGVVIQ